MVGAGAGAQPNWLAVMERAQCRRPGILAGRTMAACPNTYVGLYHDVCGTLNGRRLGDGTLLYGCTCNLSIDLDYCSQDFNQSFPQVRRQPSHLLWACIFYLISITLLQVSFVSSQTLSLKWAVCRVSGPMHIRSTADVAALWWQLCCSGLMGAVRSVGSTNVAAAVSGLTPF